MTTPEPQPESRPSNGSSPSPGATPAKAVSAYPGGSPALPASPSTPANPANPSPAVAPTQPTATKASPSAKPVVNAALKKRPRDRVPGRGATTVAVISLLVAVGAVLVAVYSLNVAREAKSSAAAAASDAERLAKQPPANAAPAPASSPTAAVPTPSPTPSRVLVPELRSVQLNIPATEGCQSLYVDVDSAQVGAFNGHEFYFSSCVGPLTIHLDNVDAAASTGTNLSPDNCATLLAGVTPTAEVQIPATSGTVFCLLTSKATAARAGIPQHLAIVQIRQVAADRTVALTLDTFRVP